MICPFLAVTLQVLEYLQFHRYYSHVKLFTPQNKKEIKFSPEASMIMTDSRTLYIWLSSFMFYCRAFIGSAHQQWLDSLRVQ
jgi:hypothetical protein